MAERQGKARQGKARQGKERKGRLQCFWMRRTEHRSDSQRVEHDMDSLVVCRQHKMEHARCQRYEAHRERCLQMHTGTCALCK